jgi:hypothetical protein
MRDEERHADAIENTVEAHVLGPGKKVVAIARAEDPLHVLPVVRYGVLALA